MPLISFASLSGNGVAPWGTYCYACGSFAEPGSRYCYAHQPRISITHTCGHVESHRYFPDSDDVGVDIAEWQALPCSTCTTAHDEAMIAKMEQERDAELALQEEFTPGIPSDALVAQMAEDVERAERAGDKMRDEVQDARS